MIDASSICFEFSVDDWSPYCYYTRSTKRTFHLISRFFQDHELWISAIRWACRAACGWGSLNGRDPAYLFVHSVYKQRPTTLFLRFFPLVRLTNEWVKYKSHSRANNWRAEKSSKGWRVRADKKYLRTNRISICILFPIHCIQNCVVVHRLWQCADEIGSARGKLPFG